MTPWVGRLIIANAVVLLLLMTVFTSPDAAGGARRSHPARRSSRPWTFVTYMFVHAGLLHLLGNMLMLFVFGPAVEQPDGQPRVPALLPLLRDRRGGVLARAVGLHADASVPFVGASGAVLGVGVAFALLWPDAELLVFPLPMPIKARTLHRSWSASTWSSPADAPTTASPTWRTSAAPRSATSSSACRRCRAGAPHPPPRAVERVVMVQSGAAEPERRTPPTPMRPRRRADADPVAAEVDRVLDKISEQGIASLTAAERRFLDEVSQQKKQEH